MGYFEISKRNSKGGKRKIKMSLLEIASTNESTNKNGLHWVEEYVNNNIESAIMMPICAEFASDDKSIPLDHGLTSIDSTENEPLFEDSEVVGAIEKAYVTDAEIDGETKRILCGEGYIYQQRYPNFVKWLSENVANGKVLSSIEIMGTPENNNLIIYDGEVTKEFRTPKEFLFSGSAILSVEAADDSAVILQMNSLNSKESEDETMDEKTINLICDSVKNAVSETNSKNAEYEAQITELNNTIAEKDGVISELNASVEQIKKAIADMEVERDAWWAERDTLQKQLGEALAAQRLNEMNSAIEGFTEEQRAFAKDEIEAFKADPMNGEINSITDKIYREIGKTALESAKVVETNSVDDTTDIFGEINSTNANTDGEDIDIFATVL